MTNPPRLVNSWTSFRPICPKDGGSSKDQAFSPKCGLSPGLCGVCNGPWASWSCGSISGWSCRVMLDLFNSAFGEESVVCVSFPTCKRSPDFSENFSKELSNDLSGSLSNDLSGSWSKDLSESLSKDLSGSWSKDLSGSLSKELFGSVSNALYESLSNDLSGSLFSLQEAWLNSWKLSSANTTQRQ